MYSIRQAFVPVPASAAPSLVKLLNDKITAGFPSPAEDFGGERCDVQKLLRIEKDSTYFMKVKGPSMEGVGIFDKCILVIRSGKKPKHGQIVVAEIDGAYTVKQLSIEKNGIRLKAANPSCEDIVPQEGQQVSVWGVVTGCIKLFD
jgi:DNA polymerase V